MSARLAAESNKFCTRSSDCKLGLGGITKRDRLLSYVLTLLSLEPGVCLKPVLNGMNSMNLIKVSLANGSFVVFSGYPGTLWYECKLPILYVMYLFVSHSRSESVSPQVEYPISKSSFSIWEIFRVSFRFAFIQMFQVFNE